MNDTSAPLGRLVAAASLEDVEALDVSGGRVAFTTVACPGREPNEDALGIFPIGEARAVVAVADGVGGQPAGESASRQVLECVWDALLAADPEAPSLRGPILDGIEAANQALLEAGAGAATTLALAELNGSELRTYHVGDAALLCVGQRGRIKLQTVSHSPVGYAVESGMLDPREALEHEERHLISNAVGSADMRIEVGTTLRMAPRDTLLLATDGVFDNAHRSELVRHVRTGPLEQAASQLRSLCRRRMVAPEAEHPCKPDDLSLILFRPSAPRRAV